MSPLAGQQARAIGLSAASYTAKVHPRLASIDIDLHCRRTLWI
jgi:hypothetical protein